MLTILFVLIAIAIILAFYIGVRNLLKWFEEPPDLG